MRIRATPQICALTLHLERKKERKVSMYVIARLIFILSHIEMVQLTSATVTCLAFICQLAIFGSVVR
eukprot:5197767-Karenia_brevis.AAC.1